MFWIFLCLLMSTVCATGNHTMSFHKAAACKQYINLHGYSYEEFFAVSSLTTPKEEDALFEMHIGILAASNGHILLSSVPNPGSNDPVYEIVVGGGNNKFTELRRNLRRSSVSTMLTPNILSPVDIHEFYIKITEDGTIAFGSEGEVLPLVSYVDLNVIKVNYFSFTSWKDVPAKFFFDCPVEAKQDNNSKNLPSSYDTPEANQTVTTTEKNNQTDSGIVRKSKPDQIRDNILRTQGLQMPPTPDVNVTMGYIITFVRYNVFSSELVIGMKFILSWTDLRISWDSYETEGNTTSMYFEPGQIWKPSIVEASSIINGPIDSRSRQPISVWSNGFVKYEFNTQIITTCRDEDETVSRWPNDEYLCAILFENWNVHEKITFDLRKPNLQFEDLFIRKNFVQNVWSVESSHAVVNRSVWDDTLFEEELENDNQTEQSDRLVIILGLKREAFAYDIVFYVPLLVLISSILLSFWSAPLVLGRVWFYAGTSTILTMGLSYIDYLVPCYTLPSIVIIYVCVLVSILIAMFIHILLMHESADCLFKSSIVHKLLKSNIFRKILFLREIKTCQVYESVYEDILDEEQQITCSSNNVQQMDNCSETDAESRTERQEFAEVIDKLMFLIFSVGFAVLLTV